jgi:NAD(P)H-hydrate epimerase
MAIRPLSRDEVRSIDTNAANWGLPTLVLMENAGRAAAELLRSQVRGNTNVVIVCGSGNNAGDGAVLARHWDAWGYAVQVVWTVPVDKIRGDAAIQHHILTESQIAQQYYSDGERSQAELDQLFACAEWLVDGLFGTGLTRPVEGWPHAVIEAMNRSGKPILALDLPSGLDSDSGEPCGIAVRASLTATFVAPKLGFSAPGALAFTGDVHVVEIGVPRKLLEPFAIV